MASRVQISPNKTVNINRFFKLLFFSGGIYRTPQYQKFGALYSLWLTGFTFFVLLGNAVGLSNRQSPIDQVEILIQATHMLFFLAQHWGIRSHRNSLMEFVSQMQEPSLKFLGENAILQTEHLFTIALKKIVPSFYLLFASVLFSSLVESFFVEVDFSDSKAYVMPFWYVCADSGENNFPIKFLCWRMDSYPKYILMNSLVVFILLVEHLTYVAAVGFHVVIQKYLIAHFEAIRERILALTAKMEVHTSDHRDTLLYKETDYDRMLIKELMDIMRCYQYTRCIVKGGHNYLCYTVSANLTAFYFTLLFCSFLILIEPTLTRNYSFVLKLGSLVVLSLIMFTCFVFGAEIMKNWDQSIADVLYDSPWHHQSKSFKKLTIQFLLLLSKPLEIRAFGTYMIGFVFLMNIFRNLYSALNIMLATLANN